MRREEGIAIRGGSPRWFFFSLSLLHATSVTKNCLVSFPAIRPSSLTFVRGEPTATTVPRPRCADCHRRPLTFDLCPRCADCHRRPLTFDLCPRCADCHRRPSPSFVLRPPSQLAGLPRKPVRRTLGTRPCPHISTLSFAGRPEGQTQAFALTCQP